LRPAPPRRLLLIELQLSGRLQKVERGGQRDVCLIGVCDVHIGIHPPWPPHAVGLIVDLISSVLTAVMSAFRGVK
jgi:hypothetical protein